MDQLLASLNVPLVGTQKQDIKLVHPLFLLNAPQELILWAHKYEVQVIVRSCTEEATSFEITRMAKSVKAPITSFWSDINRILGRVMQIGFESQSFNWLPDKFITLTFIGNDTAENNPDEEIKLKSIETVTSLPFQLYELVLHTTTNQILEALDDIRQQTELCCNNWVKEMGKAAFIQSYTNNTQMVMRIDVLR
jgi:hypothetical protein